MLKKQKKHIVCGGNRHRRKPDQPKTNPVKLVNAAFTMRKPLEMFVVKVWRQNYNSK